MSSTNLSRRAILARAASVPALALPAPVAVALPAIVEPAAPAPAAAAIELPTLTQHSSRSANNCRAAALAFCQKAESPKRRHTPGAQ